MQAKRRVLARAIAASGSSNAPGTGITVTLSRGHASRLELGERRLEQPRRHVAVEPRHDDADGAPLTVRDALEHGVAGRHGQLAGRMLDRVRDVIGERNRGLGRVVARELRSPLPRRRSWLGEAELRQRPVAWARRRRCIAGRRSRLGAASGSIAGQPSRTFSLDASRSSAASAARLDGHAARGLTSLVRDRASGREVVRLVVPARCLVAVAHRGSLTARQALSGSNRTR